MPKVTILTEAELRRCVAIDAEAIDLMADAFVALAQGRVVMPPILRLDIEDYNGEIDVKTAYMRGLDSFAVKMSPGFFDNPKIGLPSVSATRRSACPAYQA
jgi:ornithine cyclodeaminase